jgi:hypothetical protein
MGKVMHTFNDSKDACCGRLGHTQKFCDHQAKGRNDSIKACLCAVVCDDGVVASVLQIIIGNCRQEECTVDYGTRVTVKVPWTETVVCEGMMLYAFTQYYFVQVSLVIVNGSLIKNNSPLIADKSWAFISLFVTLWPFNKVAKISGVEAALDSCMDVAIGSSPSWILHILI